MAAALWLGSTLAVALHLARRGARSATVLRRHRGLVTGCFTVVAASGLVTVAVQVSPGDLLTSGYGLLVVASAVLLAAAGWLRTGSGCARAAVGPRAAVAVLATEGVLLAAASGVGTGLIRVFPPEAQPTPPPCWCTSSATSCRLG